MDFLKSIIARIWAVWCLTVFVTTLLLVWLVLTIFNHYAEPRRTRFFQLLARGWIFAYFFFTGVRLSIMGKGVFREHPKFIILCNHRSFLDILLMTPFIPTVNKTVGKDSFMKIPLFRKIYGSATILVNRYSAVSRMQSLLAMKQVLADGFSLCIYPEGRRNKTQRPLLNFQKGAFMLAVKTRVPIIPSILIGTDRAINSKKLFYALPAHVKLYFLDPIFPTDSDTVEILSDRVRDVMESAYLRYNI